ncbi:MAG: diaminopimelate epimerase [Alphaproteobacteria bacterium]
MSTLDFLKMHGLGNDFVIIDSRKNPMALSNAAIRLISDRRRGAGCDQLIVICSPPESSPLADIEMKIFNADGSEAGHCGNAARCVAFLMLQETGQAAVTLLVRDRLVVAEAAGDLINVDMGLPVYDALKIPLSTAMDTLYVPVLPDLPPAVAVSMGNPHAVFFVENAEKVPLEGWGVQVEHHPLFPDRVNVEFVSPLPAENNVPVLRMRVWERGGYVTEACGSGACAVLAAAVRRGLVEREAIIRMDGGDLFISRGDDGRIFMKGPVAIAYHATMVLADHE